LSIRVARRGQPERLSRRQGNRIRSFWRAEHLWSPTRWKSASGGVESCDGPAFV